jgi:hypothetical protein
MGWTSERPEFESRWGNTVQWGNTSRWGNTFHWGNTIQWGNTSRWGNTFFLLIIQASSEVQKASRPVGTGDSFPG